MTLLFNHDTLTIRVISVFIKVCEEDLIVRIKKLVLLLILAGAYSTSGYSKIFSVDTAKLLRESREGRNIMSLNENAKRDLIGMERKLSEKVTSMRDSLESDMRAGKLSNDQIQDRYQEIGKEQRKLKYELESAREDFEADAQKRVIKFTEKALETARVFCKDKGGSLMIDKSARGVIFVADATDQTKAVLKKLNDNYAKLQVKSAITKKASKKTA